MKHKYLSQMDQISNSQSHGDNKITKSFTQHHIDGATAEAYKVILSSLVEDDQALMIYLFVSAQQDFLPPRGNSGTFQAFFSFFKPPQ